MAGYGLVEAGVIESKSGKVRLLTRDESPYQWDPTKDKRLTVWECTQQLILHFNKGTERGAATIAARLGSGRNEKARAKEALDYNALVISWPESAAWPNDSHRREEQKSLFK